MSRQYGYSFIVSDSKYGKDTEDYIKKTISEIAPIYWAYICHDKESYNEHDASIHRMELQRNWAEGFQGKEKYASVNEYIDERMKLFPAIGNKKESSWQIVFITDKSYDCYSLSKKYGLSNLIFMSDKLSIMEELKRLTGEDNMSRNLGRHQYQTDEVKANFDWREYIQNVEKNSKWEHIKRGFDPATIFSVCLFTFFIVCAVKLVVHTNKNNQWIISAIIGGIGLIYCVLNYLAVRRGEKENRHVSGMPFLGAIHLLVAGLISPCKYLALLCVLDYPIGSTLLSALKHGSKGVKPDDNTDSDANKLKEDK